MRIKMEGLEHSFDGAEVLRRVDFDDEVATLAVIGPSGGGKSTLLRILGGLLTPSAGTVSIDGTNVVYDERTLPAYRASLGFVFQSGGLFCHLSARENIALPLREVHSVPPDQAGDRADELLARFGLSDQAGKRPGQLSGGQRQRVAIARAIAAHPRMLLLDEPTSSLDPEFTSEVLDILQDLKAEGVRFVMVTHEIGFARRACDKVAFLHGGRFLEYGESNRVLSDPATPELSRFLGKLMEWSV